MHNTPPQSQSRSYAKRVGPLIGVYDDDVCKDVLKVMDVLHLQAPGHFDRNILPNNDDLLTKLEQRQ